MGQVKIPYVSRHKAFEAIDSSLRSGARMNLAFCNANTMLKALREPDYAQTLSKFLVLNDGVGVDICSMLFRGHGFSDNLNGTDFLPFLLNNSTVPLRIFLLGSRQEVVEEAARRLSNSYPRHRIVGAHNGFFGQSEADDVVDMINGGAPNLVLVGMGNPRQEHFIAQYRSEIEAPVVAGVGAYLDFTAGAVVRAPNLVRKLRMEWAYRLWLEPKRLGKRYTTDLLQFLAAVTQIRIAQAWNAWVHPEETSFSAGGSSRRLRPDI